MVHYDCKYISSDAHDLYKNSVYLLYVNTNKYSYSGSSPTCLDKRILVNTYYIPQTHNPMSKSNF